MYTRRQVNMSTCLRVYVFTCLGGDQVGSEDQVPAVRSRLFILHAVF
jgi:hypothetical protein